MSSYYRFSACHSILKAARLNWAAGVFVTSVLGSVFRAVLSVSRTAFIWAFDIALYYSRWGDSTLGEAWDSHSSPIQLVGFLLGLAGTVVYAQGTTRWVQDFTVTVLHFLHVATIGHVQST